MLKGFKKWLQNSRGFLFSRYTKDSQETQEPERTLIDLPEDVRRKLVDKIENLPSNPANREAIVSTLDEAFDRWRADPHNNNNNNSVVILSSPVVAVARILSQTLEEWSSQKQIPLNLLPFSARPTKVETIESKLKYYLESEPQRLEALVIPNLSWCFLRSLEGLKGIEYLQSLLCNGSPDRFWIIGGGQVGWEYLNSVCNIEAYCGKVFALPEIEAARFREWFEPIINDLGIVFDDPSIDRKLLKGDKDNQTHYFEHLADISNGVSTVAVQAFLKSMRYEEADPEQNIEQDRIVAQTPVLPELPELDSDDRYLLYSLLLHGDLTISALAESLGDTESQVQARVQVLRHEGAIEQRGQTLKINPIYYPKIKRNLAGNNFVIDEHLT
ncbi:hypothetical protein IQ255_02070 [Pleurocapsales cyanobacterium LEGE 10410]|nr:hypothetical protein [Pleurocapsales cyanobacterium LEGE 10410]